MPLSISTKLLALELEVSGSVAGGGNASAGVRYSISTTIQSGSISPSLPSYVDVPGFPLVGPSIILDDSNYDNIYGRVLLDVDSTVQNAGPPETTTIYLTNPSIQTSTASIYFVAHPKSGDYIATASYTTTFGSDTNAFGNRSFAIGNSTLAVQDDSFTSGIGTIALGPGQTVIGAYNSYNLSDLFIIGNGTDANNRSNIVTISTTQVAVSGSLAVTGSIYGTASWALNYNETDPVFISKSGSFVTTSSFNSFTGSYNTGSFTGSFTGQFNGTASYAITASYALNAGGSTVLIDSLGARVYTDDTFITAGSKGYKHIPYNADIIKTRTIANTNGYIDVNIKRNGTTLGTISLSNQSSSLDTVLSGWTTLLNEDDLIEFYVSQSSTYITDISIFIDIQST